ncbi:AI-2E family transporter [Candidatus Microgenomates bacterium]|nr:AI-2E family transporter [Candidatus Microgenomates bacterium]
MKDHEHPLSWQALFRILILLMGIYFVWKTGSILVLILVSAMLAAALNPLVRRLNKRLPLFVSTFIVVFLLFIPFVILGAIVIPSFIREFPGVVHTVNRIVRSSSILPDSLRNIDLTQYVQSSGTYVLKSTSIITGVVTSIITLLFLTFYFIYDSRRLVGLGLSVFPKDRRHRLIQLFRELADVNGQYIRGNLIISLICGVTIYIGLMLMGIPFAAPLAMFAAIMDLLPLVGSTIGLIPALIIGFAISPIAALLVLVLFLVYQQIENAILAPTIYNKALNISPAISFLAVLMGSALFGIVGAFLSLPIAASLPAIIQYAREENETNDEKKETERDLERYKRG